jgi:hypothetical protein
MDAQTIELISSAIAGPASGVAVALICLGAFMWFLVKHLLPQQNKTVDAFVAESQANRKVFESAVDVMGRRLDAVEDGLEDLGRDVSYVRSKL